MLPMRMRRAAPLFAVAAVALLGGPPVQAQSPAAPDVFSAPWTLQGRAALRERLSVGTFTVRRRFLPPPGVTSPSPPVLFGVATCMADGALWTASALVDGAPATPTPLEGSESRWALSVDAASGSGEPLERPVAVVRVDSDIGLAAIRIVDGSGQPVACGAGWRASPGAETGGLTLGRVVYAAVPGDSRLRTVTVQGPGRDPFGWYLAAEGDPLPPGTPVFDAAGRWLSLAGPQAPDAPTRSHLVPDAAIRTWLGEPPPAEGTR